MIAFIVPIKPKRFSKNWEKENRLLERTLGSIHHQTHSDFKIYIVYTDLPEISFTSNQITFIPFTLPFIGPDEIEDYESAVKRWMPDPDYAAKMFDKGRKITLACHQAKVDGCHYIMAVDSDDLISNCIARTVHNAGPDKPGWVIRKGYIYLESKRILLRKNNINAFNGSTNIVNASLVPLPDMNSRKFYDFNFFEGHGYLYKRMIEMYGITLPDLPYPGVIYSINENNASAVNELFSFKNWKTLAKIIIMGKRFRRSIRKEFNYSRV